MWAIFRALLSSAFLLSIVLSIPLAFDVGGRDSGLAFSLALFAFYTTYSTVTALTPPESRRIRWLLSSVLRWSQWLVIPTLLIWALNRYAVDAGSGDWVARTIAGVRPSRDEGKLSWWEWLFGYGGVADSVALGGWDRVLRYSSPVFQLLEGFCSLLVIQAAGRITRWLVNKGRSDLWVILLLVISGSVISTAIYFLWRIARFPQISNVDAILIGIAMTSAIFICSIGIISGRGNPVESSLLFAYMVLCVYQIFTDYQPSPEAAAAAKAAEEASRPALPPLPPIIMASYSTVLHIISSLPSFILSSFGFIEAIFQTVTPSVIISLTYRIIVFYSATRIIPMVQEYGARALAVDPILEDSDTASRLLAIVSWFSPSILIAVYTSLLLQHFSTDVAGEEGWTLRDGADTTGNTWRWINLAATMVLYSIELYLGGEDGDGMNHWKTD